MKQNTNITPELENLLVTRNGEADEDYYNAIRAAERADRIQHVTTTMFESITAGTRAVGRVIGIFTLDAYAGWYDTQNNSNTRQEIRQELGVSWLPRLSSTS